MRDRDGYALREIVRLCQVGAELVSRGHDWYVNDVSNVPGLAAESLIIKIGDNVARLSSEVLEAHPNVPWSLIKRMSAGLGHRYGATDHEAVWDTMVADLPTIQKYTQSVLAKGRSGN